MLSSKLVSKLGVREAAAAPAKRFLWERAAALGVGIAPGRSALFGAHQDGLIAAKAELPEGDQDPIQEALPQSRAVQQAFQMGMVTMKMMTSGLIALILLKKLMSLRQQKG